MIHKVLLRNFKRIEEEVFILSDFDLLIGSNNSGKSTLLQALAIWQFCVDQFKRSSRKGSRGIQIVLPDFTALPLPEFILLWKDKVERKNVKKADGGNKPDFIIIEIQVFWKQTIGASQKDCTLNVQLRYQSPLSIYAIPDGGWSNFNSIIDSEGFPQIVYVPPFSGLEPLEKWQDDGNVRQNVGKGQPGSVLRNLLYRVIDLKDDEGRRIPLAQNNKWKEICRKVDEWFGVKLNAPDYEMGQSTRIDLTFAVGRKDFDIISAGSGFHQILTLLAFFHGYPGITTILFDEPDAHLHVNLQKQILAYFKQQKKIQFLIATHSEEFIRGVEVNSIISMLSGKPKRIQSTESVVKAMSEVDNMVVVKTRQSPFVLYVEGEDDARILIAWASNIGMTEILSKFHIQYMGGGTKREMLHQSNAHFVALRQIVPEVKRMLLMDMDNEPILKQGEENEVLIEWQRKNIENYLLVPEAWKEAVLDCRNETAFDLFNNEYASIIDDFFAEQGLELPRGYTWQNVKANVFQVVDGKKILFENSDSLFHRLRQKEELKVNREKVATNMPHEYIHADVHFVFKKLEALFLNTE